jgi:hypothetical protein
LGGPCLTAVKEKEGKGRVDALKGGKLWRIGEVIDVSVVKSKRQFLSYRIPVPMNCRYAHHYSATYKLVLMKFSVHYPDPLEKES